MKLSIRNLFTFIVTFVGFLCLPHFAFGTHDISPPTVPRGVTGHGLSDSSIQLNWWPSQDNVGIHHYNIYRYSLLVGSATTNSYLDTGLSPNTPYSYNITAVDPEGNESAQSIQRAGYSSLVYTNPTGGNVSISTVSSPVTVAPGQMFRVSWQVLLNPPGTFGHHDAHFEVSLDDFGCNPPACWYSPLTGSSGNTFWTDTTAPSTTGDIWYMPDPHPDSPSTYYNNQHHHFPLQRIVVTNGNPLAITTTILPNTTVNVPYSQTIAHNNSNEAVGPFSCGISQGRLPNNLSINNTTCVISGAPLESGTFNFTVRVKATSENYAVRQFTLTVGVGTGTAQLVNISTRANVQTGTNVMIGGFYIGGTASKTVLIRARGPSMSGTPFNLAGTMSNPMVQLYAGSNVIAQNDNWQVSDPLCSTSGYSCGTPTQIVATGLDPCQPNPGQTTSPPGCAQESAILITLLPGGYSAILSGVGGGTGVGLVEVFETGSTTVPKLINISTRANVQTGANVMIGGFYIGGTTSKTVLIRARGPSMSGPPFNLAGTLSNPMVQLFAGSNVIAQNDNWQVSDPLCGIYGYICGGTTEIMATGLDPCQPNPGETTSPPGCSQESAILVTLPPGGYTAIVRGVGGTTGVGLVEVFEVSP